MFKCLLNRALGMLFVVFHVFNPRPCKVGVIITDLYKGNSKHGCIRVLDSSVSIGAEPMS